MFTGDFAGRALPLDEVAAVHYVSIAHATLTGLRAAASV
jgi:hypothetical protein